MFWVLPFALSLTLSKRIDQLIHSENFIFSTFGVGFRGGHLLLMSFGGYKIFLRIFERQKEKPNRKLLRAVKATLHIILDSLLKKDKCMNMCFPQYF